MSRVTDFDARIKVVQSASLLHMIMLSLVQNYCYHYGCMWGNLKIWNKMVYFSVKGNTMC